MIAITLAAIGAQPAFASPVDLVCPFAATAHFAPGVTLSPQTVSITGVNSVGTSLSALTPCSSVLAGLPYLGGAGQISASGTLACIILGAGLTPTVSGTLVIPWNNGEMSTISYSILSVGPVPVFIASVTSGAMQGATVTVTPAPTGLTGNCLLSPVTSLSFAGVLVFSRL